MLAKDQMRKLQVRNYSSQPLQTEHQPVAPDTCSSSELNDTVCILPRKIDRFGVILQNSRNFLDVFNWQGNHIIT